MSTRELDQAKSEAFAERMIGMLNDAALALMTSIGHRTGLFDVMASLPPSSWPRTAARRL
jgi:winged helix-turn-helix protein